jgi:hypothetical protein
MTEANRGYYKGWLLILLPLVIVGLFWWSLLRCLPDGNSNSVDTVNSLFSALAFAGLLIAIYLQRNELMLQRNELRSTRAEFEVQNQTLKKQRFENTLFSLISLHHEIANGLFLNDSGVEFKGRAVIRQAYLTFSGAYQQECRQFPKPLNDLDDVQPYRSQISKVYGDTYRRYEEHLSHYLKNFNTIVRFVKQSDLITDSEREEYYRIVKSQINSYEILLLYYHFHVGIASHEKELFNDLLLGSIMNTSLLPDLKHSFIFDPDYVIKMALSMPA